MPADTSKRKQIQTNAKYLQMLGNTNQWYFNSKYYQISAKTNQYQQRKGTTSKWKQIQGNIRISKY